MAYLKEIVNLKEMFEGTRLKSVLNTTREKHQLPFKSTVW